MTPLAPLPDDLGPHFGVRAARELDVGRSRLRRSDLARPFHGVRSRSEPEVLDERVHAYLQRLPERGFFSHTTAAALWGIPVPSVPDPRLHVSYPNGHRPPRTRGVIGKPN